MNFLEKNDVLTFIWPSFFPLISEIFYTVFIILHDKHNRQVMSQVKRLILPIENANWHAIRYDSICYVNFLLLNSLKYVSAPVTRDFNNPLISILFFHNLPDWGEN